ncbi:hypothetical protein E2C01_082702 [Portunus trituberculatus]|uniref:Uncharacterized protein n=1 Tax=Portunus trituberculatus TaxID=210409 RepID=A0A5B7IZ58_PORTR|nr:hypothetical protein [Portunus trituberculatus]
MRSRVLVWRVISSGTNRFRATSPPGQNRTPNDTTQDQGEILTSGLLSADEEKEKEEEN